MLALHPDRTKNNTRCRIILNDALRRCYGGEPRNLATSAVIKFRVSKMSSLEKREELTKLNEELCEANEELLSKPRKQRSRRNSVVEREKIDGIEADIAQKRRHTTPRRRSRRAITTSASRSLNTTT